MSGGSCFIYVGCFYRLYLFIFLSRFKRVFICSRSVAFGSLLLIFFLNAAVLLFSRVVPVLLHFLGRFVYVLRYCCREFLASHLGSLLHGLYRCAHLWLSQTFPQPCLSERGPCLKMPTRAVVFVVYVGRLASCIIKMAKCTGTGPVIYLVLVRINRPLILCFSAAWHCYSASVVSFFASFSNWLSF